MTGQFVQDRSTRTVMCSLSSQHLSFLHLTLSQGTEDRAKDTVFLLLPNMDLLSNWFLSCFTTTHLSHWTEWQVTKFSLLGSPPQGQTSDTMNNSDSLITWSSSFRFRGAKEYARLLGWIKASAIPCFRHFVLETFLLTVSWETPKNTSHRNSCASSNNSNKWSFLRVVSF